MLTSVGTISTRTGFAQTSVDLGAARSHVVTAALVPKSSKIGPGFSDILGGGAGASERRAGLMPSG